MKKKNLFVLISLGIFSLACLGSSSLASVETPTAAGTATILTNASPAGAISSATSAPTLVPIERCVMVVAVESLHLRGGASENDIVLTWLYHGVVVELVSDSDPDWWRVRLGDLEGFARSIYLQETECK